MADVEQALVLARAEPPGPPHRFGAADEVRGAIGSGVDFERRVAEISQLCRQPAEIRTAFDAL
ncbi:hypothetical protein [Paracoccus sp. S-4012]|uniref:hypothetical protein n=1 Tax=Paracoccus sp. S-4012 TaxID=2665648 RepID=UPI001E5071D4|nr:hypothetical protein [Paracoccus sp. S-4012]